jgi:hypothetical protein
MGHQRAGRLEEFILRRLKGESLEVIVLRTAFVLSPRSHVSRLLRRWWFGFPLVPTRLRSCCVEADDLFTAIDCELERTGIRKRRTYAVIGTNKSWRERLRENGTGRAAAFYAAMEPLLFPLAFLRLLLGLLYRFLARKSQMLRCLDMKTLFPASNKDALSLYSRYSYKNIQIVGYNNGAIHFGHKYPGKTVVSMVRCGGRAIVRGSAAEFDAGMTLRKVRDELEKHGRELPVLPNYSYVSLGTSYFIPIHGSASDFTTIAETIQSVLLYDPVRDRLVSASRDDPEFGCYLYNPHSHVLLLRLTILTKPKTSYYVTQFESTGPTGKEILNYFADPRPSNVEIRKAGSGSPSIKVYQYYTKKDNANSNALDVPRDALGRLWDRLEENRVSSVLFHGLNRLLAYHVELFLSKEDFVTFWYTHTDLHLLKIQLRYIRRDGFPNSPFRDQDCVSADLFMLKKHRKAFDLYLRATIPAAKLNPGKHTAKSA